MTIAARKNQLRKRYLIFISTVIVLLFVFFGGIRVMATGTDSTECFNKYYTSYEIKSGDTLNSIAKSFTENVDVSVKDYKDELCQLNHINENDDIISGEKLIVFYYSSEDK